MKICVRKVVYACVQACALGDVCVGRNARFVAGRAMCQAAAMTFYGPLSVAVDRIALGANTTCDDASLIMATKALLDL